MKTQRVIQTCGLLMSAAVTIHCAGEAPGPATCAEARDLYGVRADGSQTLYLDGDKMKPWTAYCAGMATAEPREYLELVEYGTGGQAANYSQFREGDLTVTTLYRKVRIDPLTLELDITDTAFARDAESMFDPTQRISSTLSGLAVRYVPFGVAMQCGAPGVADGIEIHAEANIDLAGTPFALGTDAYCAEWNDSAAVAITPGKAVALRAEGAEASCGKASIRCLPNPTINGEVASQRTIPLTYGSGGSVGGL